MNFSSTANSTQLQMTWGKFEISISDYKDQCMRQQDKADIRVYWDGCNDITSMITAQLGHAFGVSNDYIPANANNLYRVMRVVNTMRGMVEDT